MMDYTISGAKFFVCFLLFWYKVSLSKALGITEPGFNEFDDFFVRVILVNKIIDHE